MQTVYNLIGGKDAVLKAVYDVALAGDEEPVPMAERPLVRAMIAANDAETALAIYAQMAREVGERVQSLVTVVLAILPGRKARHELADDRAVVIMDDEVMASGISRVTAAAAAVAPAPVRTSVSRRTFSGADLPTSPTRRARASSLSRTFSTSRLQMQ